MMNKTVLVFALCIAPAVADYIKSGVYASSDTCQGDAVLVTAALIECESNGASSYRVKCFTSSYEGANILTYLNGNCSGEPVASSEYPVPFECTNDEDAGTSYNTQCVRTDDAPFVAPSPASNTYIYKGRELPPITCTNAAGGDLTQVNSYPCDECIGAGGGSGLMYFCNPENLQVSYFESDTCEGAPMATTEVMKLGCDESASSDYEYGLVSISSCDLDIKNASSASPGAAAEGAYVPRAVRRSIAAAAAASESAAKAVAKAVELAAELGRPAYRASSSIAFKQAAVGKTATCTGPGEFCCPAPSDDVNNCPDSARSDDCDPKGDCCCG